MSNRTRIHRRSPSRRRQASHLRSCSRLVRRPGRAPPAARGFDFDTESLRLVALTVVTIGEVRKAWAKHAPRRGVGVFAALTTLVALNLVALAAMNDRLLDQVAVIFKWLRLFGFSP